MNMVLTHKQTIIIRTDENERMKCVGYLQYHNILVMDIQHYTFG